MKDHRRIDEKVSKRNGVSSNGKGSEQREGRSKKENRGC